MQPVRVTANRVTAKELFAANPNATFITVERNQYDLSVALRRQVPRRFLVVLIPDLHDPGAPVLAQIIVRHLNETYEVDNEGNWKRK